MNFLPRALTVLLVCGSLTPVGADEVGHRVILQGNGKLAVLSADGTMEWELEWGGIHDSVSNSQILDATEPVIR